MVAAEGVLHCVDAMEINARINRTGVSVRVFRRRGRIHEVNADRHFFAAADGFFRREDAEGAAAVFARVLGARVPIVTVRLE